jgi:hypothetical protein
MMALFSILTDIDKDKEIFIEETNIRLLDNNMVSNPFKGKIKSFIVNDDMNRIKELTIVYIEPIYFNLPIYALPVGLMTFYIFGFNIYGLIFILISCLSIFWSKYFYFIMFYLGLRKSKYKGKINMLDNNEVIKLLILEV